jgi:DNA topoisomerase IB
LSDATRSACQAGLRRVDPGAPGLARLRKRTAFAQRTAAGRALRDERTLSPGASRARGNTSAACRKFDVHPVVQEASGATNARARAASAPHNHGGLRAEEQRLLRLLRSLARARPRRAPC